VPSQLADHYLEGSRRREEEEVEEDFFASIGTRLGHCIRVLAPTTCYNRLDIILFSSEMGLSYVMLCYVK